MLSNCIPDVGSPYLSEPAQEAYECAGTSKHKMQGPESYTIKVVLTRHWHSVGDNGQTIITSCAAPQSRSCWLEHIHKAEHHSILERADSAVTTATLLSIAI
jgi:hypothetical protein